MTTLTVVALCLVAAGAAAYDENHAFRAPVVELPQLAKSEPIEFGQIASGRRLLRADPSKSLWDKKLGVRRDTDTRFGQGRNPDPHLIARLGPVFLHSFYRADEFRISPECCVADQATALA